MAFGNMTSDLLFWVFPLLGGLTFADDGGGSGDGGDDGDSGDDGDKKTNGDGPSKTKRVGDMDFKVPEEFKDEKWAQKIKSKDDVWRELSHAQKLIGRKGVIRPSDDAPKEEWDEFYNAQGRPENPEGYEFKTHIEELKDVERNAEIDNFTKNLFHRHGIPKQKAEQIVKEYEEGIYKFQKPVIEKIAKVETEFQKLSRQVLGENKAETMDKFKDIMREPLGDSAFLAQKLETMDNDALMTTIVFAKNLHDKYVGENKITNSPDGSSNMTGDLRSDFRSLSEQKIKLKLNKNLPKHVKDQKIQHLNSQMKKIGEKAAEQGIDLFSKRS
jgi:hypothetical protein